MAVHELLFTGLGSGDGALTVMRVGLGVFFSLEGGYKLFNPTRHASLVETLREDKIPCVALTQWFVPGVEFLAGGALVVGLMTPLAALGLFIICLVATCTDAIWRVPRMNPLGRGDAVAKILYLPEVLYLLMLGVLILLGAGPWSLDALIAPLL